MRELTEEEIKQIDELFNRQERLPMETLVLIRDLAKIAIGLCLCREIGNARDDMTDSVRESRLLAQGIVDRADALLGEGKP